LKINKIVKTKPKKSKKSWTGSKKYAKKALISSEMTKIKQKGYIK